MVEELVVWNGWTIDLKLRQFRKVIKDPDYIPGIRFVDFDSVEGCEIFREYVKDMEAYHNQCANDYVGIQLALDDKTFSGEDADILAREMYNGAKG